MKNNFEFNRIIDGILMNQEFQKLKEIKHHGITRYDHSLRVAYYTYLVTKMMHLNYKSATKAALLHDFFLDEVKDYNGFFRLRRHPNYSLMNAKKYFSISKMEEDIIKSHMFPVTFTPPKYLESWIVDIVDDCSAIYEKGYVTKNELKAASTFLFLVFINIIRF